MPTYSYACKDCGHAFDIQQAFSDDALTECPSCGGSLRKVFSAVGVVFKGSGFYRTDSRSGGGKGSGGSSSGSGPAKDTAAGTGTGSAAAGSTAAAGKPSAGSTGSSTSSTGSGSSSTGAA
ncbi:FmdB family zinc ribbon protein [Ornithinimicrobium kibberense]|uniref:FmdB family zinc ribbon protein n=1 Tax=Ornithinimicrobium kibberense TaxID=282060 RepID=A0ABV5UZK7_9MICO|nr:FmdB family zinc ribbon protein [Ornithinimicrobium kibberense]